MHGQSVLETWRILKPTNPEVPRGEPLYDVDVKI